MAVSTQLVLSAITVSVAFLLVFFIYRKRKISTSALAGTLGMGVLILLLLGLDYGYIGLLTLLVFFLSGNLVTRYKYSKKFELGVAEAHRGMRDIQNVLGNGLSPLIFAVLFAISSEQLETLFLLGFSGSVATATADTFSTEIGQADGTPRLITTLKHVPVGTNGGVSLPGFGAAALGAGLIALVSLLFLGTRAITIFGAIFFIICLVAGFSGCLIDSFLGATVENRDLLRLNKHHVNILATLSGGLIAMLLGAYMSVHL
ncbi:MAG TPA: DUF92 domain-containing protein [Methanomicrobia archaeon]|nr:DUF92 domain-containing protein [Methanomicrobia archaeon]